MENETIIEEENNSENQPKQVEKTKNVFCYKNFTLTFLGAFVSNLGNTLYLFAVSFYILSLTNNNAFIQGAYLATGGIVYVLVTLFGGVISDRFHKGKIMFMCDYAKGGMLIAFTLLLMLVIQDPSAKVVVLFIIAVLGNIIAAIFSPAASSLLPRIVPEKSYQQAQSYNSLMQSSLGVLGVILAAILYSVLDIHVLFFIVGGCYVLSGVSEMFIKYDYQKNEDKLTVKQVFKDIGDGMKYIGKLKPLLFLMLGILLLNFFVSPLSANFLPYFVATDVASRNYLFSNFLTPEMWSSVIQVAYAIGMIIMVLILSNRPQKDRIYKGLSISLIIFAALYVVLTTIYVFFVNNLADINVMLIAFVPIGITMGMMLITINIPITTKMLTIVDKDKLGKVNSVIDVGSQGLIPLSNFLAGLVISGLGASWLCIISTAGLSLMTIFLVINKHVKQL
jgi:MFS family permease